MLFLETPNCVLLCTILKPAVDITVDALNLIMSPYGKVLRIVIFCKKGVQAFVEFDSVVAAQKARAGLEGKDIYPSCCTLKIEFAKVSRLNVHTNSDKTRDFTNPNLPTVPTMIPNPGMMGMPGAQQFYPFAYPQCINYITYIF